MHGARDDELHRGQRLQIVDAVVAEMIGRQRHDGGDRRVLHGEAAAQHPTARRLEHGKCDRRVLQDAACADWARPVAGLHLRIVYPDTIGAGVADVVPCCACHGRDHAHHGRLAVRAGDEHDRDVAHRAPVDRISGGDVAQRPAVRTRTASDAGGVLVEGDVDAAALAFMPECDERRAGLGISHCTEFVDRRGRSVTRETDDRQFRRHPGRLADVRRGHELIDGRVHEKARTTRIGTLRGSRIEPAQRAGELRDARMPGTQQRRVLTGHRVVQHDVQHSAHSRVHQVGAHQAARFHDDRRRMTRREVRFARWAHDGALLV